MSAQNNRVMGRVGARHLTPEEEAVVTGGIGTTTICTIQSTTGAKDGDPGECG